MQSKVTLIDRIVGVFSPERALERQRHRIALDMLRSYDAAKPSRTSGGYGRKNTTAQEEVSRGHRRLAGGAQDLVRNNALATRIKATVASNIVGQGIKPDHIAINHSKKANKRIQHYKDAFKEWSESHLLDYEGHNNFYGLQWLIAATVVESGGVFVRKIVDPTAKFPLVLQLLEQQYLDSMKNTLDGRIRDGIEYHENGKIAGYWLHKSLDNNGYQASTFCPSDEIRHVYWKDRAGQHLGVSWLHSVADLIDMRQEWRDAVLLQQRIAACFGVIVKDAPRDMGLGSKGGGLRDIDGHEYTEIEAGMIAYADANTDITTVTPPNLSHTTEFNSGVIQDIAVGVGMTREQLTGDFSRVTWASGRLARGEFYTNLDRWQQFMMIPALNTIHDWFDEIYAVKFGKIEATRTWIQPHRSAVNPKEELDVDIAKVRTCAMTPQQFSRKHGVKFEDAVDGWREALEIIGDLTFDFDPSKFSLAGNQIVDKGGNATQHDSENEDGDKK